MSISNLNPTNYKRFFAFGCSYTQYKWPTWSDIISQDIPIYQNWGKCSAGNHYIFNSIVEANNRYRFKEDDLIIVMWTFLHREDRYCNLQWQVDNINSFKKTYGADWFDKYALDRRSYLIRDLAYVSSVQDILKQTNCEQFWTSPIFKIDENKLKGAEIVIDNMSEGERRDYWVNTFDKICDGNDLDPLLENLDVIEVYKDIFSNINKSLEGRWSSEYVDSRKLPNNDFHPTPLEALNFLDTVWPNNMLSVKARNYALYWQEHVTDSNYRGEELIKYTPLIRL
jgi:hypothetical protein